MDFKTLSAKGGRYPVSMSFDHKRKMKQKLAFLVLRGAGGIVIGTLCGILLFILYKGAGAISLSFIVDPPREAMTEGGVFPAIVGTFYLTLGAILIALPLGAATSIYLSEYAKEGKVLGIIRMGIQNLAGVPSVVFGLFGLALFVTYFKFGISILSGSLTLGLLILPIIIGASEEAFHQVPQTFREASVGLGATKWQTILHVVLPAALPGVLTGSILGIARAAGETAPIMFTAATFYTLHLPKSPLDEVMALPYHIYVLATAGTHIEQTRPLQYGAALVLISMVLGINLIAIILRAYMRRKRKW